MERFADRNGGRKGGTTDSPNYPQDRQLGKEKERERLPEDGGGMKPYRRPLDQRCVCVCDDDGVRG